MSEKKIPYKIYLEESEMPKTWYNVRADMKNKPAPLLNPETFKPMTEEELSVVFCEELVKQELDNENRYIEIPEKIRDFYKMYRPAPLIRAYCLEEKLQTPAKIYYKFEGNNTSGSHKLNSAIAQEGLDNNYGAQIGKTLMHVWGKSVTTRACARAAAGSDARMGGCSMPVVINSGSGNQGMTVSLPVIVFADEWEVSHEKLCRSLVVSNLIAIHQKYYIGSLSAYCGAVSAACGAGAGITYMYGGTYQQVSLTIINTLGNIGGIVCDGAKPSCAAKIATSVDAALMAFQLSIQNKSFLPGEGIIKDDIEETIKSMGYIGRVGMRTTDTEILNVMIDRADINEEC